MADVVVGSPVGAAEAAPSEAQKKLKKQIMEN
jgi:hypothetical protein